MKKYPAYKDSGIEWIGKIPEHWEIKPVKYSAIINRESLPETTDANYHLRYVDVGNVNQEGIVNPPEELIFSESPSRARRIVKKGDTIISTVRTYLKAIAYIDSDENHLIVSTGFAVLTPQSRLNPKYLYFLISCEKIIDAIMARSVGVSYPAINSFDLASIPLWCPASLSEQQTIADFLDRKTARIDTLIDKKKRQIELLKEQRQAVINQAVTKGLDPDVSMKDSGIEWLGKIPKHWEIKKLKFISHVELSNVDKKSKEDEYKVYLCNYLDVYYNDYITPDLDFMEATATKEQIEKFTLKKGDVLITKDSEDWKDIAVPAYITEDLEKTLCGYHLSHIKPYKTAVNGEYLFRLLYASTINHQFVISAHGITRYGLGKYYIENSLLLLPPKEEQSEIVAYLNDENNRIDNAVNKAEKQIQLLQEYRTALISEAVTGKIDVRKEGQL